MFSVTEEEIQSLILKHNGKLKKNDKVPIYDLKDVLKCGLAAIYAKNHTNGSTVEECQEQFTVYKKHKCIRERSGLASHRSSFVEVADMKKLDKAEETFKMCWTGYNLAVLTSNFNVQGYFRNDLLFQKKLPEACALFATSSTIYIGHFDGSVVCLDPLTLNEVKKQQHTDIVTSIYFEEEAMLTSSMDGSIFYHKKIHINDAGVLDVKYIGNEEFLCSCADNSLVLHDSGTSKTYVGHKEEIKSLSYNKIGISTSKDGTVGYITNTGAFETEKLGVSHHKRLNTQQFIGYGFGDIKVYDAVLRSTTLCITEQTLSLDYKENLIAYAGGSGMNIRDMRSNDVLVVSLNAKITDISFAPIGNMLFVNTEKVPFLFDIRHI